MKLKNFTYGMLGMLLIISSCKKQDNAELTESNATAKDDDAKVSAYTPDNSLKVVAYFPSYRDPAGVTASKYKLVTHMFYAFLNPDTNGGLLPLPNPTRFSSVIATARANGCKVGISVAGAANLKTLCTSAAKRTTLCNNLVNFVINNNLDGLDMDWESPRSSDGTDITYAALMSELSTKLHAQGKFLSAAITPGVYAGSVRDGIKTEVFGYTDFFNIMMYDGSGWDPAEPNQHASYNMCVASMDYWVTTRGMAKEKAVVGLPSYGLSNTNSTALSYRELLSAGASSTANYFTTGGDQYGYTGTVLTAQKATLGKDRGNGVILWEMYGDSNTESISLLKAARTTLGIGNNSVGIFETFATTVGRFTKQPTYSGTTVGIATTSTASRFVSGSSHWLRVILNDNTTVTTPWFVRLLSGDGLPANNVGCSKTGNLYFWMKTASPAGTSVRIWVDDSDGTEQSPAIAVTNTTSVWTKYNWNLANGTGWTAVSGNGVLNAVNVTLDAIIFERPTATASWTSYVDDVGN